MSWKVLITASPMMEVGRSELDRLREANCQLVIPPKPGFMNETDLMRWLPEIDAVIASVDQYSARVLQSTAAEHLKLISRWGVGYDSVDLDAANRLGIVVAYTPGMLNDAVADYTFALILSIARRIHEGHATMQQGQWTPAWGHDVHGKTLGMIGCGRIGQAVAQRAAGFNLRLLGCDPRPSDAARKLGIEFAPLDRVLSESDFLTLHTASTAETRGLLGQPQLRRMKPDAYVINTARGALIDEDALVKALQEGWIAGAALDAYITEPLPPDHPLRQAPNLLLTPHQASYTRETGRRVSRLATQAVLDLIHGKQPQCIVNPDTFQSPNLRASLS